MTDEKKHSRPTVRDILETFNIQIVENRSQTTLDDVAEELAPFSTIKELLKPTLKLGFQLGKALKLKSTKHQEALYATTYARVIGALVLSIQTEKLDLQQLLDTNIGAYFEVHLPIDMFSVGGQVNFTVFETDQGLIMVRGYCEIPGQYQAWGKGTQVLNAIFSGIDRYLNVLPT